jgi:hypothetical protein
MGRRTFGLVTSAKLLRFHKGDPPRVAWLTDARFNVGTARHGDSMVAFTRGRRQKLSSQPVVRTPIDALIVDRDNASQSPYHAAASHRAVRGVEVRRDSDGSITEIRIGRWRSLVTTPGRRLAEVRELGCDRVAVRIERLADDGRTPASEIWQLYDLEGRLNSALQTTPDGRFAMMTNYQTRQACRLVAKSQGELQAVETWAI